MSPTSYQTAPPRGGPDMLPASAPAPPAAAVRLAIRSAAVDAAAAKALMRAWWDRVWGEGDLDALDDLITDPYRRHTSAGSETIGRDEYKRKLAQTQRLLNRPETTVDDEAVVDDKIWTRATSKG